MAETKTSRIGCYACQARTHHGTGLCTVQIDLFSSLSDEEHRLIVSKAHHLDFKRGETIFHAEDPGGRIIVIRYGKIKLFRVSADGKEHVVDILNTGELLGEDFLFADDHSGLDGVALENTGICVIYASDIEEMIMKHPEVGAKLIRRMGRKMSEYHQMFDILSAGDTRARLAGFLLFRSQRIGSLRLALTREEIASSINLTRETVSRRIKEMSDAGLIETDGYRSIVIKEKDALSSIFDGL